MSTSLLYHAFGIRGYSYTRTAFVGGTIHFAIDQGKKPLCCSACGSSAVHPRGRTERTFRTLPIGRKAVVIHFEVPRVHCESCGLIRQVEIGFADERRSYTKAFERYALELSRLMTIQDVAKHLNVGWDLIKDIVKRDLSRRFGKPKLKHLRQIAIDEISVGKGHKYLTLVLDLETGAVVFVGKGKGADALRPFWKRIWGSHAKIKAVAMDMSPAYQEAVSKYLSKAKIVFDHFHVIKLFNEKLSDLRRLLFHQAEDKDKGSSQNRVGRFESPFESERVRTGLRSPHLTWSSESRETPATKKTWLDFRRHDSGVRRHQATGPGGSQHQGLLNPWRTVGVDNAYRVASSSSSNRFYRAASD